MIDLVGRIFTEGFIYIFIYLLLFVIAVLESIEEFSRYRLLFALSTCIFLALFTGFRWETGTDWASYKKLFDEIELDWTFLLNVYNFDIGYVLFNALIRVFSNSYTLFLVIDSLIALGILFLFIFRYSYSPNITLFVFYNSFFVSQFMGSNRRIIAIVAVLFVFLYMYEKRKSGVVRWGLFALAFHRTSIISLLAYLAPFKRFTLKQVLLILMIALVLGIPQIPFKSISYLGDILSHFTDSALISKMKFYSETSSEQVSENINPAIQTTLSIIKRSIFLSFYLLIIRLNKGVLDPLTDYFFNIYIFGFATYILLNGSPIFQILTAYFAFLEVILIGRMWYYTSSRYKMVFFVVLFFYGFFQLISALNTYPDLYIPYKAFFNY